MAQKTLEETFHATRETEFNDAFWNKFVGDVAARFRALDAIKIDWETVSQQGIQVAIDRINEVLGPAAQRVQNIAALGFLSVESVSSRTLAIGTVNFVAVAGDQLDLFVPSPFVAVTRKSSPLDYAIGQVTFFDRATGSMDIYISFIEGDVGPHDDWTISAVAGQAIAQTTLLAQSIEARDTSLAARQDAVEARDTADQRATTATVAAGTASTKAGEASTSAAAALTSETNAQKWSSNPEDTVVASGLYSAFHWYRKTLALYNSVISGFGAAIHAATAKTALVAADELSLWDSVSGALRKITMTSFWAQSKWQAMGIGSWYTVDTSKTGAEIPPSSDPSVTFIELTAGLTGTGGYNNGKLTSESVSGSFPSVIATAVISVAGSPMNGQTIDLLNTEGRSPRPSTSPGTKKADAQQPITGTFGSTNQGTTAASGSFTAYVSGVAVGGSGSGTIGSRTLNSALEVRTDVENRIKEIGAKVYMRVK